MTRPISRILALLAGFMALTALGLSVFGLATSHAQRAPAPAKAPPPTHHDLSVLRSVKVSKRYVALTIDLGETANRASVESILASLDKRHIHCTWFVTGWFVSTFPDLIKRIAHRGDDLGNHTSHHPHCTHISKEKLVQELSDVEDLLDARGILITAPKYFRPPYGEYNQAVLDTAASRGYRSVLWSATSTDYDSNSSPARVTKVILAHVQSGGIILVHAGEVSRKVIPGLTDDLIDDGYRVLTLRELVNEGE